MQNSLSLDSNLLLSIHNPEANIGDQFGYAIATVGNNILVGAPLDDTGGEDAGSVYLFSGTTGELLLTIHNPEPPPPATNQRFGIPSNGERFGYEVAAVGNNILVGAPYDDKEAENSGSVYLFDGTTGELLLTLNSPEIEGDAKFGRALASVGNKIVVGAPDEDTGAKDAGTIYVFDGITGELLLTVHNPEPDLNDRFGTSIASVANNILVGAPQDDKVYLFDSTTGNLLLALNNPDSNPGGFGFAIAAAGDDILIGARDSNDPDTGVKYAGVAYLFDGSTGELLHTFKNPDPDFGDSFGRSVTAVGDNIIIGSRYESSIESNSGAVYIFSATTGELLETIYNPEPGVGDLFAHSLTTVGSRLLVGTINNDEGATDAGSIYSFNLDGAGNTLATARDLGVLNATISTPQTFFDWVGTTDRQDYYRFEIDKASSFNLNLYDLSADANVFLLNDRGQRIASSRNQGTASESISRNLDLGTYYVSVRTIDNQANTDYRLRLKAVENAPANSLTLFQVNAILPPDLAGNNRLNARDLGLLDATPFPEIFFDGVGLEDRNDVYRFELLSKSNFVLSLNGLTANSNVSLQDEAGNIIIRSTKPGSAAESIDITLDAGIYYFLVRSVDRVDTNYNLTVSAKFIVNDEIVSDPNVPLLDPEFDPVGNQVTWQDKAGNLWVASVDSQTGDFMLETAVLLDSGLAPLSPKTGGTGNGPEWAYSKNGSQVVYTKLIDGQFLIGRARWTGTEWEAGLLTDKQGKPIPGFLPFGSQDPEDERPLISYKQIDTSSPDRIVQVWRELDDPETGGILPGQGDGRWVTGEKALLRSIQVNNVKQLFKYEINTETLTQLTFDNTDKQRVAFMWQAPEFNNELVFFVGEGEQESNFSKSGISIPSSTKSKRLVIYRNIDGQWTEIETITSPVLDLPWIHSAEPFVYNGKSYISMMLAKGTPDGVLVDGSEEIWFVGIDPEENFYRKVSSDGNLHEDPEPFATDTSAFIYYRDRNNNKIAIVRRADTGLGVGTTLKTAIGVERSYKNASDIGLLDATPFSQTFSDAVGLNDRNDIYRFELLSESNFKLQLEGLNANVNVFLRDEAGNTIVSSRNPGTVAETIDRILNPGTYYVLLRSADLVDTNYDLTLSAQFIVDDILVSDPNVFFSDPEFDDVGNWMVWANPKGELWVTPVNPQTGDIILEEAQLVDSGLARGSITRNGPEWVYARNGSRILYTKDIDGNLLLGQAKWTGSNWEAGFVTDEEGEPVQGVFIFGTKNPDDEKPLISYRRSDATPQDEAVVWRELDNPNIGGILPGGANGRWVQGERSVVRRIPLNGVDQIFKYDVDTEILTQLTFDNTDKFASAFMWQAPEFNNDLVLMSPEIDLENEPISKKGADRIEIYRNLNGQWTKIGTITSPIAELPLLASPEPFVSNGKSYISLILVKRGPNGEQIKDGSEQMWFVGIDPEENFYRQVNNDEVLGISSEPESFVSEGSTFIFYSQRTPEGTVTLRRSNTGLGLSVEVSPLLEETTNSSRQLALSLTEPIDLNTFSPKIFTSKELEDVNQLPDLEAITYREEQGSKDLIKNSQDSIAAEVSGQIVKGQLTNITSSGGGVISLRHQEHMWIADDGSLHVIIKKQEREPALALLSSFDSGTSWQQMLSIPGTAGTSASDGLLKGDRLFLVYPDLLETSITFSQLKYDSAARQWVIEATTTVAQKPGFTYINPTLTIDNDRRIWVVYNSFDNVTQEGTIELVYSEDSGTTWQDLDISIQPPTLSEKLSARLVRLSDGVGLVYVYGNTLNWAYRKDEWPVDSGWQGGQIYQYSTFDPGGRRGSHFSVVVDDFDNIHIAGSDKNQLIYLKYNGAEGTWNEAKILTDESLITNYMQISKSSDNSLFITYDIEDARGDYLGVLKSSDLGNTFELINYLVYAPSSELGQRRPEQPAYFQNKLPIFEEISQRDKKQSRLVFFNLDLDNTQLKVSDGVGNSLRDVLNIGLLDTTPEPKLFSDAVGIEDRRDVFRFELQAASSVNLALDELSANANLFLLDAQGNNIISSKARGTTAELITQNLEPGTYYVSVNSSQSANTDYQLTLSAEFITDDDVVSNPNSSLPDPEFDGDGFQVAWQEKEGERRLFVAPVDPVTGDLLLSERVVVDSGLAPTDTKEGGTGNGPEWVYSADGSQILYTKLIDNNWYIGRARKLGMEWQAELLTDAAGQPVGGSLAFGTLEPGDPNPLIKYVGIDPTSGDQDILWRELNNPNVGGEVPGGGGRWVQGEGDRALVRHVSVPGYDNKQLFKYDVYTDTLTQATFDDDTKKQGSAFMWQAPEFNGDLVLMTPEIEVVGGVPATPEPDRIGIYRNTAGQWTKINEIESPNPDLPYFHSPEILTYNSKSYISTLMVTTKSSGAKQFKGAEVWLLGVEPDENFARQVSEDDSSVSRNDPESLITESGAFIYYAEITADGTRIIHRADTGLGSPLAASSIDPLTMPSFSVLSASKGNDEAIQTQISDPLNLSNFYDQNKNFNSNLDPFYFYDSNGLAIDNTG